MTKNTFINAPHLYMFITGEPMYLPTDNSRPNQKTYACRCPFRIDFILDYNTEVFVVQKSKFSLEHCKEHPVSEEAKKLYGRNKE